MIKQLYKRRSLTCGGFFKLVCSHNLTAIADRQEINDHDRCEHTREYIGVEAQFDGVNAQQCESHADQQRAVSTIKNLCISIQPSIPQRHSYGYKKWYNSTDEEHNAYNTHG